MPKIIKVESARHMDSEEWEVGKKITFDSGLIITEIKDMSAEFESSIHIQYDIFANNKLYKSLVNMPVKLEYSLDD